VHATTACLPVDPLHQWNDMHAYVDGGKMDGFGAESMSYYDEADLPFDYWLASTFALADRYFPSVLSGTDPNELFLRSASAGGAMSTGDTYVMMPTIDDRMHEKGFTTALYQASTIDAFKTALRDGSLADLVHIRSQASLNNEHPPGDVQVGEAWTREVYEAINEYGDWSKIAFIWMYDEGGGFFDHVPPPHACPPNDGTPNEALFFELGIRVPMVLVSAWARRHYVSHVVHEHTSVTRFIETVFDLGALTERDANSDALLDMFDFDCPDPSPFPVAPLAGVGGCR
jgi:phospholipase C